MICDKESKTAPISHARRAERLRPEITEGNWLALPPPPGLRVSCAGLLFPYRWKLCHVFRGWKGIANCYNGIQDELTTFWLSSFELITFLSPFSRSLAKPWGFNYSAWKRERRIFIFQQPCYAICHEVSSTRNCWRNIGVPAIRGKQMFSSEIVILLASGDKRFSWKIRNIQWLTCIHIHTYFKDRFHGGNDG